MCPLFLKKPAGEAVLSRQRNNVWGWVPRMRSYLVRLEKERELCGEMAQL